MDSIIEVPSNHPALPQLFDPQVPNNPALWAVFMGRHHGMAWVDHPTHPAQCLIRTDAVLTYASQWIQESFLNEAIHRMRQKKRVWLVRNLNDPAAPSGYKIAPRLEFYDYDPHSHNLMNLRKQLPNGFELRAIDMQLLEICLWRDDMAFYCGSLDNFLKNGLGLCLMNGEEIIVEAYASALGASMAEIGAITHEDYRGKGYAPITVAYLIEQLEQLGFHAYWSCDQDNLASIRVARKLGFRIEKMYEIYDYEPYL